MGNGQSLLSLGAAHSVIFTFYRQLKNPVPYHAFSDRCYILTCYEGGGGGGADQLARPLLAWTCNGNRGVTCHAPNPNTA